MNAAAPRHIAGAAGPPRGAYDADVLILALDRPEETRRRDPLGACAGGTDTPRLRAGSGLADGEPRPPRRRGRRPERRDPSAA